jgi:Uncharacterised nucleotidyltransferase
MRPYPIGNGILAPTIPREFAALMDALQFQGANTDALLKLEQHDWQRLMDFCDRAHLTLVLAQVHTADFPPCVLQKLEKNLADNALRFERLRTTYIEAAEALGKARIPHLLLKGFSQAPDFVKDPRRRVQSDLDLFCLPSQISKAEKALHKIGYKPIDGVDYQFADHTPTLGRFGSWKWNGNMYDPEMPASIELHFCLWNERASFLTIPECEKFWDRRVTRQLDDLSFPTLDCVDQLGYIALHVLRGVITGDWVVRNVHELASFLNTRAGDDEFWEEWERLHSSRLRALEAIAFWFAEAWFSCALHKSIRKTMESMPNTHREWLERFGGSPLEVMFRRNKDGRILHFLLMETWRTRREVLRRAIIPVSLIGILRPKVQTRNRQDLKSIFANRHIAYLMHLGDRAVLGLYGTVRFLARGASIWFSQRPMRAQFPLFLIASFFLTWASPHTSFCSIFS